MTPYDSNATDKMSPQWQDEITARLNQVAMQRQQQDPQQQFLSALDQYQKQNGVSQGQSPQLAQLSPYQQTVQAANAGDPQAVALKKRADGFLFNDEAAKDSFVDYGHSLPNSIDPTNSYQMNTLFARWSRESGYNKQQTSPQMPSPEQISIQDLGNVMQGKGSNYLGLQQDAEKHISTLAANEALSFKRSSGGSLPASIQVANEIEAAQTALDAAIASGDMAAAKKANQRMLNLRQSQKIIKLSEDTYMTPEGVQLPNAGAADAKGILKEGETSGDQRARLAYAQAIEREKMLGSPVPEAAMKSSIESEQLAGQLGGVNADLDQIIDGIQAGSVGLGPIENRKSQLKNWAAMSDPNSRNYAKLLSTLEKQRNASLLLAKGVQTEGDAQRAWDQVVKSINDGENVAQALMAVREQNRRNAQLAMKASNRMMENYGRSGSSFEDAFKQQPSVSVEPSGGLSAEKRTRLEELRAKKDAGTLR